MPSQPANTTINTFQTLRSYPQPARHDAIGAVNKGLRPLVMAIPGKEDLVFVANANRNTSLVDFSPYMGEARPGATRGMPRVVGVRAAVSFETAQEGISGITYGFKIGRHKFLKSGTPTVATNDIFAKAFAL